MDAKVLDILENCFEWNRDRKLIRKIRKEVEDFERWTEMKAAEMLRADLARRKKNYSVLLPKLKETFEKNIAACGNGK